MKLPAHALLTCLLVYLMAASALAGDAPRNDNPVDAARYDAILARVHRGEYSALSELADTNSRKAIALLRQFIVPQSEMDDPYALAAGAALAKMHAEKDLHEKIMSFGNPENAPWVGEWLEVYLTLSFMRSKATVRMLAALLYDEKRLQFGDGRGGDTNEQGATLALARMKIPGAPPIDWRRYGVSEEDFRNLKAWWAANQEKFQGDGPLPSESNPSTP